MDMTVHIMKSAVVVILFLIVNLFKMCIRDRAQGISEKNHAEQAKNY